MWVFVIMSLLLSVITITMVYIYTRHDFKLADPKYAFYSVREESRLFNPKSDLESEGYKRTEIQKMDWDLLWSHEYPFAKLSEVLRDLKPNQKVNHWPGISSIANKLELSTSKDFAFVPKSFRIPKDFVDLQDYATSNKSKKFVQKHIFHRNVSIVEPESIKKDITSIFVQELIQEPYLIDGYKFDLSVFVLLTSVNPLRLYIFDEVVLRFCRSKYVNYTDKDSYVVRKNYLSIEAIPSLEVFYKTQTAKHSLDSYLRSKKRNPNLIWTQIESSVREVFLKRESRIIESLEEKFSENQYENFFELFKFDFLVTNGEDLKVWMMEANMSPIYSPEDIMSNILSVVLKQTGVDVNSAPMDPLVCMENHCNSEDQCKDKCELCTLCLKARKEVAVKSAYRENQSERRRFGRIFPKPITYDFNLEKELKTLDSNMNKFMTTWYFEKCRSESKWCQ